MTPRTIGALAMRPTETAQGNSYFFSLSTGRIINRAHATKLPMPDDVIDWVHTLARRQKANPGLVFLDWNQVPDVMADDYNDDNYDDDNDYEPGTDDDSSINEHDDDDDTNDDYKGDEYNSDDDSDYHPAADGDEGDNDSYAYESEDGSTDDDSSQDMDDGGTTGVNAEMTNNTNDGGTTGVDDGGTTGVDAEAEMVTNDGGTTGVDAEAEMVTNTTCASDGHLTTRTYSPMQTKMGRSRHHK
jgi:hypothetical protein